LVERGELTDELVRVAFSKPFRRYQSLALDAFEQGRPSGRRRVYLVMPPGSGKTVVGLEIARRLGDRVIALGPNTAILAQWQEFQPQSLAAGTDTALATPVTILTYQALCNLEPHSAQLDYAAFAAWQASRNNTAEPVTTPLTTHDHADLAHFRQRARQLLARGGDHAGLLALLHPNGRALVDRIRDAGRWTIILDECHHLLEMWGYLVRAIVTELGDRVFLVGLTATPPSEMAERERELYQELFGHADFEVPTPAVVKEGNLALAAQPFSCRFCSRLLLVRRSRPSW
jgi:superfamily II DNA or RNA helicase